MRMAHYIRQWRKYRGLTIAKLAEATWLNASTLVRIETGSIGYTRASLEKISAALSCSPADLLMRDPTAEDTIWQIWDELEDDQRQTLTRVAKAMASDNDN